ncbi:hypothetical protein [Rhizobium yanglingense]
MHAIILLGDALGMRVTVEGVETAEQKSAARKRGMRRDSRLLHQPADTCALTSRGCSPASTLGGIHGF